MRRLLAALLLLLAAPALAQVTPGVGLFREDAAHSDGAWGVFGLVVRKDIAASICGSDLDYCPLQVDSSGSLRVVFTNTTLAVTQSGTWTVQPGNTANSTAWLVTGTGGVFPASQSGAWSVSCTNCTGSGASAVDDAAFVIATDSVAPAGYLADEAGPDSVNEGDVGLARMSLNRVPFAQLRDAAGNERGANVTAGNALVVDGSASTQPVSGTVTVTDGSGALNVIVDSSALPSGASTLAEQQTQTTSLQLLDDAVSTTGSAVPAKGFQATGTDGTNARALKTDTSGELQVDVLSSALPSGAATSAEQATQTASLSVLDDWDESDRAKVNPIAGQAGVQGGAGSVNALTQRVAIATDANVVDRTAVAAANNTGSCVTVDTSSDTILTSNSSRRGATILNNGSVTVFMKFGATATSSSFPVAAGGVYNMIGPSIYTGIIDGITSSSSASVCVLEW